MRTIATLLCTLILMTSAYSQKAKLSMNLEEGKTYKQLTHSQSTINQDVYGQKMKIIPFQMKMDRKGKILEMENVDAKWEAVMDKRPLALAEQVKSQMMDAFGKDARTSSIEMVTSVFPEKAVKKGAQWSSSTTRDAGMSFTLSNTYTYEGNEDGLAIISR